MSEKGNYLWPVIKAKGNYNVLSEGLRDLIAEVNNSQRSVCVEKVTFPVEYFLGGDGRSLACVCANAIMPVFGANVSNKKARN